MNAPRLSALALLSVLSAPLASVAVSPATPAGAPMAAVGQPAPVFVLPDSRGEDHRLADHLGKYVVLEWVNPHCPFVRKHYSSGNMQITQRLATDAGAVWLTINSTAPTSGEYMEPVAMGQWMLEQRARTSATLLDEDGRVGKTYGASTTPHMYIIDPQGVLIYAGAIDSRPSARVEDIGSATNHVQVGIAEAMGGKPISTPNTRAYGCSIRYAE